MQQYAIYHRADLDGVTCGALAKIAFPDVHLIPYDYKEPTDTIDTIPDGSTVAMMDVSLPKEDMIALAKRTNLLWIDHHTTQMIEILGKDTGNFGVFVFDDYFEVSMRVWCTKDVSACAIAYANFFDSDKKLQLNPYANNIIQLLSRYDIWDNKDHDYWETSILPVQFACRARIGLDVQKMIDLLTSKDQYLYDDLHLEGRAILAYQRQQNAIAMQHALACDMRVNGIKYKAIIINAVGLNSDAFKTLSTEGKVLIQFHYQNGYWKLALRSEGDLDVGSICKYLGGGGHKNAAGVQFNARHCAFLTDFIEFAKQPNDDWPPALTLNNFKPAQ